MKKKHQVRSYYDQYSSQYDGFYQPIQSEKFLHLKEYLPKFPYLLDFGGGTGVVSEWVSFVVINIDISYEMVRRGLGHRQFTGIVGDLEALPLRKNSVDGFISLTAIQNASSPETAIKSIQHSLTSSASGVLTFLNKVMSRNEIEAIFKSLSIQFEYIPFNGEDYCYLIRN